jgi:hypothetical protein
MLTKQEKLNRLRMAWALLHDADAGMQTALGDTEECYDLHCAIEEIAETLEEIVHRLEAE